MLKWVLWIGMLFTGLSLYAQEGNEQQYPDSFLFGADSVTTLTDSAFVSPPVLKGRTGYTLLDTLASDTLLKTVLAPFLRIRNYYNAKPSQRVNIPTVKEIETHPPRKGQWKFWVICFILLYVSFVRISNQNNFRVFILSVFNLKLSERIWDEQRSVFNFVILQLFAIYLFIAALFINYFFELHGFNPLGDYFLQYLAIFGVLIVIYLSKFIIHWFLGVLLKMNRLGVGFVANTVSVNNFLSLVILPFIILIIYNEAQLLTFILQKTVVAIFFIGVAYRMFRIAILSHAFFSFPKVYLFIYLCALEVAPWFVIVKFINHYQI